MDDSGRIAYVESIPLVCNSMPTKDQERSATKNSRSSHDMPGADAGLDQTVSEGSTVVLNGNGFSADHRQTTIVSYSWKQISDGKYNINLENGNQQNPTFKAPYIIDDGNPNKVKTSATLKFQLIVSDNSDKSSEPAYVNIKVKRVQRALIFQGGVALGAYEAGVYKALYERLRKIDEKRGLKNRLLFDIVAGTSIGSMNAAVLVSCFIENKSWNNSVRRLLDFWEPQKNRDLLVDKISNENLSSSWNNWWDGLHYTGKTLKENWDRMWTELCTNTTDSYYQAWCDYWRDFIIDGWYIPATGEAARRHYSSWQSKMAGTPNVATGIIPWSPFGKFFDFSEISNLLPRPDNKHVYGRSLKETLEKFVQFPVKTKESEPRFLLVSTNVQTGNAVTFDSYEKKEYATDANGNNIPLDAKGNPRGKYYSEYGSTDQVDKYTLFYNKGIEVEHVLASGTFPMFFDYPKFRVFNSKTTTTTISKEEEHIFWDGGYRSNTPLRELIQAHTDYYWDKTKDHKRIEEEEEEVPDLEVYISDLWPSELKEKPISFDPDFVEGRKDDILLGDKTDYDEKVANMISDYVDLTKHLIGLIKHLAKENNHMTQKRIEETLNEKILNKQVKHSKHRTGDFRSYKNLTDGRFRLTKVVRIDHKDDGNQVAGKIFDYSSRTIDKLIQDGYNDASIQMDIQSMKDEITKLIIEDGRKDSSDHADIKTLQKRLHQIQASLKIENGSLVTISLIEQFINQASTLKKIENAPVKEEETLTVLIHLAKQLEAEMMEKRV